jgi:hypothetical protein
MSILSRFHETAASQEHPHAKVKQTRIRLSRGEGLRAPEELARPSRWTGKIRAALSDSEEILLMIVLWVSSLTTITSFGLYEVHGFVHEMSQF